MHVHNLDQNFIFLFSLLQCFSKAYLHCNDQPKLSVIVVELYIYARHRAQLQFFVILTRLMCLVFVYNWFNILVKILFSANFF